jgi:hypothetical protein
MITKIIILSYSDLENKLLQSRQRRYAGRKVSGFFLNESTCRILGITMRKKALEPSTHSMAGRRACPLTLWLESSGRRARTEGLAELSGSV